MQLHATQRCPSLREHKDVFARRDQQKGANKAATPLQPAKDLALSFLPAGVLNPHYSHPRFYPAPDTWVTSEIASNLDSP